MKHWCAMPAIILTVILMVALPTLLFMAIAGWLR